VNAWVTAGLGVLVAGLGFAALAPIGARIEAMLLGGWRWEVQLQLRSDWLPVAHRWQWQGTVQFGFPAEARPPHPEPSPMAKILALLRLARARSWSSWVEVGAGEPAQTAWLVGLIWGAGAALAALSMPNPPQQCCAVVCPDWTGGGVQAEVQAEFGFAGWRLLQAWGVALGWAASAAWAKWAPGGDATAATSRIKPPRLRQS
jgi:hypothetical protein